MTINDGDESGYSLYDSDTAEWLSAEKLGVTDEQYTDLIHDSLDTGEPTGHIRPDVLDGRKVYAAL